MDSKVKKYKKSPVAIICYVLAALMLVYTCYMIGNTVATINQYYSQYDMNASFGEYFTYIMQSALTPLINTIMLFMAAYILDAVRKADPANYISEDEKLDAKDAKKEAKDAKQFARAEAAAAKAGFTTTTESSVEADFVASLDAELAADEMKAKTAKKPRNRNQKKRDDAAAATSDDKTAKSDDKASAEKSGQKKSSSSKGGQRRNKAAGDKAKDSGASREPKEKKENAEGKDSKDNKEPKENKGNRRRGRKPAAEKAKEAVAKEEAAKDETAAEATSAIIKDAAEEAPALIDVPEIKPEEAAADVKEAAENTTADAKEAVESAAADAAAEAKEAVDKAVSDVFEVEIAPEN